MTIEQFSARFNEIKEMGFVRSLRRGPTGIGFTLETLLELNENNFAHPDIEGAELKAHRSKGVSMITLFTFNHKAWKIPPLMAIRNHGSLDINGRQGLYYTMSLTPNSAGLFLQVDDEEISVRHVSGITIACWKLENLVKRFNQKIPALVFVSARVEERDGVEYFKFYRAQFLKGVSTELLADQFREGNILVDLRLHDKGTRARNHGTGFRVYEKNLPLLFKSIVDL